MIPPCKVVSVFMLPTQMLSEEPGPLDEVANCKDRKSSVGTGQVGLATANPSVQLVIFPSLKLKSYPSQHILSLLVSAVYPEPSTAITTFWTGGLL